MTKEQEFFLDYARAALLARRHPNTLSVEETLAAFRTLDVEVPFAEWARRMGVGVTEASAPTPKTEAEADAQLEKNVENAAAAIHMQNIARLSRGEKPLPVRVDFHPKAGTAGQASSGTQQDVKPIPQPQQVPQAAVPGQAAEVKAAV